jgi:ESS family glutamate:Na+ symporter
METILITGTLYFISIQIYNQFYLFRKFLIQPSIICGTILVLIGPYGPSLLPENTYNTLKELPSILISFLFSGIILSSPSLTLKNSQLMTRILRQGIFVWIIGLVQLFMGFIISYLCFGDQKEYLLLSSFIEIGWLGGHGSAAAFSGFLRELGFPEIGDFAIISATIGLLWGSISGMILVNLIKKRIMFKKYFKKVDLTNLDSFVENEKNFDKIDISLLIYGFIFPILPVTIAYVLKNIILKSDLFSIDINNFIDKLPLFFVVILFTFFIKKILFYKLYNKEQIEIGIKIFTGIILDVMILSAIATMNLKMVFKSFDIIVFYTICGIFISLLIFFISPFFIDDFPEISLINYGMATGTTAIGLMLLNSFKSIQDKSSQLAIIVYGSAAPLSAPFIGGGILSFLVPMFILKGYFFHLFFITIFILFILIGLSFFLKG